uniref:Uncharacterized protein n=1 Tax=Arundo donax TaxID=35708 RepID=A0A0A9GM53_ARUDO
MGQISDEVWKVIQSNETDIRGTVEAVYNRIVNPEKDPEPLSKKPKQNGKEKQVPPAKTPASVTVEVGDDDPEEPPGFGFKDNQGNSSAATGMPPPPLQPSNLENHKEMKPNEGDCDDDDPDVPPGFG